MCCLTEAEGRDYDAVSARSHYTDIGLSSRERDDLSENGPRYVVGDVHGIHGNDLDGRTT